MVCTVLLYANGHLQSAQKVSIDTHNSKLFEGAEEPPQGRFLPERKLTELLARSRCSALEVRNITIRAGFESAIQFYSGWMKQFTSASSHPVFDE
jgi:hypothetical protein